MKRYFTKTQLADIREKLQGIGARTDRLVLQCTRFPFKNELAREYAHHGFGRRLGTLRRCMENVFKIVPPHTTKIPERSRLYDAQINIQAFVANVYGAVDNLAWMWVHERDLADLIPRRRVGLRQHHTELRSTLSSDFQTYLAGLDAWFEWVVEYRDALAHRIPLYIPPGGVPTRNVDAYNELGKAMSAALNHLNSEDYFRLSAEQNKLMVFQPMITHSIRETSAHYVFHAQMIADFLTVEELGRKMLAEIKGSDAPGFVRTF